MEKGKKRERWKEEKGIKIAEDLERLKDCRQYKKRRHRK